MRTRPISQAVMLILVLTTLVLSPAASAQDSSAATGGGSGGSSATTASGGGGGTAETRDENTCTDTDGDRNIYEKGGVKSCRWDLLEEPGGSAVGCALHEDLCEDEDNLVEYYCKDNELKSESYTCPTGCMEGACVKELSCAQEGEMCAGIAGIFCCAGYTCQMDGTYPDASGTCVKESPKENRFRNAYWECYDSKESYEGGPTSCKSSETWQEYAEESCKGHCSSNADATATTDNVGGASPKCGVNTFKVWNPCSEDIKCSRDLEEEQCGAAGGKYVVPPCPECPADAVCKPCLAPYCECTNVVYCEDNPYNSDCVCREGKRTIVYDEPACEDGIRCPLMYVRIKYECVKDEKTVKARLNEPFTLEAPQAAVIVDYNEMHVELTAISSNKGYIGPPVPVESTESTAVTVGTTGSVVEEVESASGVSDEIMPPVPVDGYVAHLVVTMPGSNRLVQAKEAVSATIASITGRTVATNAGGGGGGSTVESATGTGVIAPSAAQVIALRQGESAEVFGATITLKKLDKQQGLFIVSKEDIIPCPAYNKCDDGTIKPCYQEGDLCVCETCEEIIDIPLCKPTVCPDGEKVSCRWDGERCICESCGTDYTPLCGNGICEEGEGIVCRTIEGECDPRMMNRGCIPEKVCYIACPEDCGSEPPKECDGCVYDTRCLPYSTRRLIEDTAVFCDFEGEWQGQLAEGDACQNDYECETNSCASGKCLDLEREISGLRQMFQKILDLFEKLFG